MKEKNSILLLGGTGTLSSAVLEQLIAKGWDVCILNRGLRKKNIPSVVKCIKGDFKKPNTWMSKLNNVSFDVIIDFLSREPKDISRVFPIFKDHCRQYIFISSACVYRRDKNNLPIKEVCYKPDNRWSYNIEKYECEVLLKKLSQDSQTKYTIIRPYITYDQERIPFGISPAYRYHRTIIERLKLGKPMFVWDGGNMVTTLTYVDDFARGVVGLLLNEKAYNDDFHITSEFHYTWNDFWKVLKRYIKSNSQIIDISSKQIATVMPNMKGMLYGDRCRDAVFDNSKIKEAVPNFSCSYNLEDGIKKILAYYSNSTDFIYDYKYDALVDRLLAHYSTQIKFIKYIGTSGNPRPIYFMYRYLPFKIAAKICRILKIK